MAIHSLFKLAWEIGLAVSKKRGGWYGPHMAAATSAIADRIPLVDIVLEIRDARIPISSEFELLRNHHHFSSSRARRIVVLNKMDLANRTQLKEWINYFNLENYPSFGVNSHNKDNVKEFLNFLRANVRNLEKDDDSSNTITVMLVGIPNVGKSALANSLHQVGRITAAEKGRLRHATVSPEPGETKGIYSFKIASHPNIYVLDTPGILPPEIHDAEVCSKLALTGAIRDSLIGEKELAQYFLGILNFSDEYKKWAKFSINQGEKPLLHHKAGHSSASGSGTKLKRQYPTDHTQDFIVQKVRKTLFEVISGFSGNLEHENGDLIELIEAELMALRQPLQVPIDSGEDADNSRSKVSSKMLNLYNTGRLGHYTLDSLPKVVKSSR